MERGLKAERKKLQTILLWAWISIWHMTLPSHWMETQGSLSNAGIRMAIPPPVIGWGLPREGGLPRALVGNSRIGGHSERRFFNVTSAVQFAGRAPAGSTREMKLHVDGAAGSRARREARGLCNCMSGGESQGQLNFEMTFNLSSQWRNIQVLSEFWLSTRVLTVTLMELVTTKRATEYKPNLQISFVGHFNSSNVVFKLTCS